MKSLIFLVQRMFSSIGISVVKKLTYEELLPAHLAQYFGESFFGQVRVDSSLRGFLTKICQYPEATSSRLAADMVANYFLGDNRTFMEIGAWEPFLYSETWWLEARRGWTGTLVEPNPEQAEKLRLNRSSTVCQKAVVGRGTFASSQFGHLDVSSKTSDLNKLSNSRLRMRKHEKVGLTSIPELFEEFGVPEALFIDIEGLELDLATDIAQAETKPLFVCIETLSMRREIEETMTSAGFVSLWPFLSGYNSWFLDKRFAEV